MKKYAPASYRPTIQRLGVHGLCRQLMLLYLKASLCNLLTIKWQLQNHVDGTVSCNRLNGVSVSATSLVSATSVRGWDHIVTYMLTSTHLRPVSMTFCLPVCGRMSVCNPGAMFSGRWRFGLDRSGEVDLFTDPHENTTETLLQLLRAAVSPEPEADGSVLFGHLRGTVVGLRYYTGVVRINQSPIKMCLPTSAG